MKIQTLGQFIIEKQNDFPYAKGELSRLLRDIGIASKIVNREVNKAGLVEILGETGDTNVQGERVKKLDVFANDQFIAALKAGGEVCAISHCVSIAFTFSLCDCANLARHWSATRRMRVDQKSVRSPTRMGADKSDPGNRWAT